ncbi:hypothetical protein COCOBI_01-8310 [Coccomyxa sp. Obi]|nr:hypothetical protein COCOBI_01-8310 [Coccomyxa sp. Obi]
MAELQSFIFRTQALHLYRSFLRAVKGAPAESQGELRREIRRGFDQERGVKDVYAMKYSLSNGRVQLKQLRDMLGMRH